MIPYKTCLICNSNLVLTDENGSWKEKCPVLFNNNYYYTSHFYQSYRDDDICSYQAIDYDIAVEVVNGKTYIFDPKANFLDDILVIDQAIYFSSYEELMNKVRLYLLFS
jgi:hypothetical protein